jgi:N-acetylneuraminate lyase
MNRIKLAGLITATHTPFQPNGALNLSIVEKQAEHLQRNGIRTVFICGSTGESHSLSLEERLLLAPRWMDLTQGSPLRVIVHVGSNCLSDAQRLAAQAEKLGALAIAALAPSYFKPRNVVALVEWCAEIAAAAPETPFYFYDFPLLTGVQFSMPDFLDQASDRIPSFNGIKFTNPDQMSFQRCLHLDGGGFDVLWGVDECLLGALALGANGAVGSSYNFAAPVYHRLLAAFAQGDLAAAREEQFRSVQLIQRLADYGYFGAAKAVMTMLGVDVGPVRPPNGNLTAAQVDKLRSELETLGFFDWLTFRKPQTTLSR